MALSDDQKATVKLLWDAGQAYDQIAAQFAVSRSAIAGLCYRNGWRRKPRSGPRPAKVNGSTVNEAGYQNDLPEEHSGVGFMDLASHHCRWPTGQGEDGLPTFCGALSLPTSSYCERHAYRAGR